MRNEEKGKRIKNGRMEGVMQCGREQRKYDEIEKKREKKEGLEKSQKNTCEKKME